MPIDEPPKRGLTIYGPGKLGTWLPSNSGKRGSICSHADDMSAENTSLSMPINAPASVGPVYGMPQRSSTPCKEPSSPGPP